MFCLCVSQGNNKPGFKTISKHPISSPGQAGTKIKSNHEDREENKEKN